MRSLIKHLWQQNHEEIIKNSLGSCHAEGLYSILFHKSPGFCIRAFIAAERYHTLWKNAPDCIENWQSIAFHPHHCDLTLIPIFGPVWNWVITDGHDRTIQQFRYNSTLDGETTKFSPEGYKTFRTKSYERLDGPTKMAASDIHTVFVPSEHRAAWFVLEGKEDLGYIPLSWSYSPLDKMKFDTLYNPLGAGVVRELVWEIIDLMPGTHSV